MGPKARVSGLTGDGIGISRSSQHKGPAWLYIQWVTGKSLMSRQLIDGYGVPPRASAFTAVKTAGEVKASKDWLDCMAQSAPIAHESLPEIVAVTEFRDTMGVALANMIAGADAGDELRKATATFKPVLAKTEA
jgi:multiple sugar transport system substrate-binding protein